MQQQSSQMLNGDTPSVPLTNITTEQIQMYLEENKQLILAILESQNQGQLTGCEPYKARIQLNLTYLAKLADAQHTPATLLRASIVQHPPQEAMSVPSTTRFGVQLNDDKKPQQQQLFMQAQMCTKPDATSGLNQFGGGNKQDGSGTGAGAAEFLGKAASGYNHGDIEPPYGLSKCNNS